LAVAGGAWHTSAVLLTSSRADEMLMGPRSAVHRGRELRHQVSWHPSPHAAHVLAGRATVCHIKRTTRYRADNHGHIDATHELVVLAGPASTHPANMPDKDEGAGSSPARPTKPAPDQW
jgi:hypothetical protein